MAPQRFPGKTIALSGSLSYGNKQMVQKLIEDEGGTLAPAVNATIDYLILGTTKTGGPSTAEQKARNLIQTKGAAIQILDEKAFYQLLAPTLAEFLELIRGGEQGVQEWNSRYGRSDLPFEILVADEDFRGLNLEAAWLLQVHFQRCDFRQANLSEVRLKQVTDCQFDEAKLTKVWFQHAEGCRFVNADLTQSSLGHASRCVLDGATFTEGGLTDLSDGSARGANLHKTQLNPGDYGRVDLTGARLTSIRASYLLAPDACFEQADLTEANLNHSRFVGANFRQANMTKANIEGCDFTNADLSGANLQGARLGAARFPAANLKGANLRGVSGGDADFRGAELEGADFTDAHVIGSKFDVTAAAQVIGLVSQLPAPTGAIGPNAQELEKATRAASRLQLAASLKLPDGSGVLLQVHAFGGGYVGAYETTISTMGERQRSAGPKSPSFSTAMLALANRWQHGTLLRDKVEITALKSPVKPAELPALALRAWCEVLGLPVPTAEELKQSRKQAAAGIDAERNAALELFRSGQTGVQAWNARPEIERREFGQFRKADLTGLDLNGIRLERLNLEGTDFSQSRLSSANFEKIDGKKTKFDGIRAKKANFNIAKLTDATFIKAELLQCSLCACTLLRTDFTGADLSGTEFKASNLAGANFTDCDLSTVDFDHATFDEKTIFPAGYTPGNEFLWRGAGKDPRLIDQIAAIVQQGGPLDFESFMKNLEDKTDASKLTNALKMLKADKFHLFANTEEGSVTGVVKSQSDPTLVYACRLDSAGEYACCTQNLNICGGLRGSLCKHLLVLLVGLTSGGALDPTKVHAWISASRLQKPKLDKDLMSEIFLKYKGAEAGEIDWRPTETVPEDFYAF